MLSTIVTASFSGALNKLTRDTTVCEYDGTIDPATGVLVDIANGLHSLTPTASPTTATSTLMKNDGNLWQGRSFNGSTQYYSKAHHDNFNIFDGDFTATCLCISGGISKFIFSHISNVNPNGGGGGIYINGSGYAQGILYNSAGVDINSSNATSINDTYLHVIQMVRRGNFLYLNVDGVRTTARAIPAGYGVDTSQTFYLGYNSVGGYWTGSIFYFRLDAEALSDERLETERNMLMGSACSNPTSVTPIYTRSTANYKTINGKLYSTTANIPRVGSDGLLIEEARTNLNKFSQDTANWRGKERVADTWVHNGALAPNGTMTAGGIITSVTSQTHCIYPVLDNFTAGRKTFSVYAKANWPAFLPYIHLMAYDGTNYNYSWFNIVSGTCRPPADGTVSKIEPLDNGWYRCSFSFTSLAAAAPTAYLFCYSATSALSGGRTYSGDGATVNTWWWGAQFEDGAHVTSYIPTITVAVERKADDYTIRPWNLNTALTLGTETWFTTFDQDVASAGTVSLGGKTFTQVGDTKHVRMPDLKHYYNFDGTGDYLTIADDATFNINNANGHFSIVAVVTPDDSTKAGGVICSKYNSGVGNDRAYIFGQSTNTYLFGASKDAGGPPSNISSAAGTLVSKKTQLVVATYEYVADNTSKMNLYVDGVACSPVTNARGPIRQNSIPFDIGQSDGAGASYWQGKIHYVAIHKGTVLSQTNVDTLYARFKTDGVLPLTISATSHYKKIKIEFEAKTQWYSSGSGINRSAFFIAPTDGTTPNQIFVNLDNGVGTLSARLIDSSGTAHYIYCGTAYYYDISKWHKYTVYFDTSNLANSYFYVDGVEVYNKSTTLMTGTAIVNLANTRLCLGGKYTAGSALGVPLNGNIKNLRIAYE